MFNVVASKLHIKTSCVLQLSSLWWGVSSKSAWIVSYLSSFIVDIKQQQVSVIFLLQLSLAQNILPDLQNVTMTFSIAMS